MNFYPRLSLALSVGLLALFLTYINPATADLLAMGVTHSDDKVQWWVDDAPAFIGYSVAMLSARDGWAAGCSLLHWDGAGWTEAANPAGRCYTGLSLLSPADGMAVGSQGTSIYWDGSEWIPASAGLQPGDHLVSVDLVTADLAWAVGSDGEEQGIITRWDGSAWTVEQRAAGRLNSVAMLSQTEGWAVGQGILRYHDGEWYELENPASNFLRSVAVLSSNDAWAVGDQGTILHWDGFAWTTVSSPTAARLRAVQMVSNTEGWIVGDAGTILFWDGNGWRLVESPTRDSLFSIAMLSIGEGWAVGVGGDQVLRYGKVYECALPVVSSPCSGAQVHPSEDANSDCQVDQADAEVWMAAFGSRKGGLSYNTRADMNADGVVDALDYLAWLRGRGKTCSCQYSSLIPSPTPLSQRSLRPAWDG